LTFDYWFLFPVSVLIATIAMASGVGGAVFFTPLFILGLQLDPAVAVGAALIAELFGFTSGLYAYSKRRLIDYRLGFSLLLFSIPAAILGSLSSGAVPPGILKAIFAGGLMFLGSQIYLSWRQDGLAGPGGPSVSHDPKATTHELTARDGTVYKYTIRHKNQGRSLAFVGGVFLGMISVGLAELQEYQLVARCRVPAPVAVATSIFVVVVSVLVASVGHMVEFASTADAALMQKVLSVVVFSVPGVILGGQIGPFVQARVPPQVSKIGLAVLFTLVGIFMLATLL